MKRSDDNGTRDLFDGASIRFEQDPRQRAEARRADGMARVEKSSGDEWQSAAVEMIRRFCKSAPPTFLCEDVRIWAENAGLASPPNGKAWGPAIKSAERAGLVECVGYAPANSSNRSPKCKWRAL